MDEMKLLQEFRAAVAPPDDAVLARARAGMLDRGMAGQGGRRARWPRLPGTRPRLALTGLAATAAAAAVFAALVVPGSAPTRPAAITVRKLAYLAAVAAAAQPAVAPGQWVYWKETTVEGFVGEQPPRPHIKLVRTTYQVWTTADSTKAAFIVHGSIRYLCPSQIDPNRSCQTIGQPSPIVLTEGGAQADINTIPVSYADLSSLPRNPVALDRYFASLPVPPYIEIGPHGSESAAAREFQIIYDLVVSYVMPPALTAELYRALADVPGVTVNDHAVDAAGRTGIGFQSPVPFTDPAGRFIIYQGDQLILDPSTYELMGYSITLESMGHLSGFSLPAHKDKGGLGTAVLKSSLVSGPGVVP
jgi:hypothetical protein